MAVHQEVGRKPGAVALGLRTKSWRRVRIALAERKYPKPQSTELFPTHALFCHGNSPHLFNERLHCGLDAVFSLMDLQGYLLLDSVIPTLSPPQILSSSHPFSFPLPSLPFLFWDKFSLHCPHTSGIKISLCLNLLSACTILSVLDHLI